MTVCHEAEPEVIIGQHEGGGGAAAVGGEPRVHWSITTPHLVWLTLPSP